MPVIRMKMTNSTAKASRNSAEEHRERIVDQHAGEDFLPRRRSSSALHAACRQRRDQSATTEPTSAIQNGSIRVAQRNTPHQQQHHDRARRAPAPAGTAAGSRRACRVSRLSTSRLQSSLRCSLIDSLQDQGRLHGRSARLRSAVVGCVGSTAVSCVAGGGCRSASVRLRSTRSARSTVLSTDGCM